MHNDFDELTTQTAAFKDRVNNYLQCNNTLQYLRDFIFIQFCSAQEKSKDSSEASPAG